MDSPLVAPRGYFCVVRYISDLSRDEARNIAVILVAEDGSAALRSLPPSAMTPRLRDQGVLDALLVSMGKRLGSSRFDVRDLESWHSQLGHSIQLTAPTPTATRGDAAAVLASLYRSLVAPPRRAVPQGKAQLIDQVVRSFRARGAVVRRSAYLDDFLFDAVVDRDPHRPTTVDVLSYAVPHRDWSPVEKDAAAFIFAVGRVEASPLCVIDPPIRSEDVAMRSHERVTKWLAAEGIDTIRPSQLHEYADSAMTGQQGAFARAG